MGFYTTGVRLNVWGNELLGAGPRSPSTFLVRNAAPSTYSFITQSDVSGPLLATHIHQLPLHLPANSRQIPTSLPCCFLPLNPLFCLFLFNSFKSLLFSCNSGGKRSAVCFLLSSRPCLNIDRDWNPC